MLKDQLVIYSATDFQLSDVVTNDELESLSIAIHFATGIINQVDSNFEWNLKMMTYSFDRHTLVEVIRVHTYLKQAIHQIGQGLN